METVNPPSWNSLEDRIEQLRDEYAITMNEYKQAKANEIEALQTNNAQRIEEARNEQQRLLNELTALKEEYDSVTNDIQVNKKTWEETQQQIKEKQEEAERLQEQIDTIKDSRTESPTPSGEDAFGSTVYVILDANAWNETGQLRALTSDNGAIKQKPFEFGDVYQTWASSTKGKLRTMGGSGEYISSSQGCLVPVSSVTTSSTWTFTRMGENRYHFSVSSNECGRRLESGVSDTVVLTTSRDAEEGWFIIPVGTKTN